MKRALIVQGGWDGHSPVEVSDLLAAQLKQYDFEVSIADTLDVYREMDLSALDLIVPNWTMGAIEREQLVPLLKAVSGGVGVAGLHGGMGDAFRSETDFHYMVGGQFICHPGGDGTRYTVHITDKSSPITEGIEDFVVETEQYYMHVDPANTVLATTRFAGDIVMPVVWTKNFGKGRVFYSSLAHGLDVIKQAEPLAIMTRGMRWAAGEWTLNLDYQAVPLDWDHL